jgi:Immunoglobulin-like domain of bacterial spore germination
MPSSRRPHVALAASTALAAALALGGCTSGDDAVGSPSPSSPPASSGSPSSPAPASPTASLNPFPSLGPDAQVAIGLPAEGSTVRSPFRFSGSSNTFEATVLWAVERPDGSLVQKGFTTATSGTGTPGTFDTEIDLGSFTGPAVLVAGGESGEDGSMVGEDRVSFTVG